MREAFEQALGENWDDLSTHAAYADWMIDQGDPRGELVRCQLALEDPALSANERAQLAERENHLLRVHAAYWFGKASLSRSRAHIEWRMERGWLVCLVGQRLNVDDSRKIAQHADMRFLRELDIPSFGWYGTLRKTDRLPGFPFATVDGDHRSHAPYAIYPLACSPYL